MQVFPREFLTQLAKQYNLSPEQEEAFTATFNSSGNKPESAQAIGISESALATRMSEVYRKFSFTGKGPNKCRKLHDWLLKQYKALNASAPPVPGKQENNLDALVGQVRQAIQPLIQTRCGVMRVLDMNQPISLGSLYTHVYILEKIPGRRRVEIAALRRDVAARTVERLSLGTIKQTEPGLIAVQRYGKLMLLGQPGSGKTTFLKHLAIQCVEGTFYPHCVPWFISLKAFAETEGPLDLLAYLQASIPPVSGVNGQAIAPSQRDIQAILQHGRALLLLDGLDEVRETDAKRVVQHLQAFAERYSRNAFVISCRLAAGESTFEAFTEVEIAPFNEAQIAHFVTQWFCCQRQASQTARFLQTLRKQPPLHELATCPRLLTLLCLVFEDAGAFPAQRWKLYRDSFKALLKTRAQLADTGWEPFYQALSPSGREAFFRQLALLTFTEGRYFFDLDTAARLTKQVLPHCLHSTNDELNLEALDIEAFLATIERQHGILIERAHEIYSFAHLTFHEYFTARQIVETADQQSLATLAHKLTHPRWREVLCLTLEMLPTADELLSLMKRQVDGLLAGDPRLQQFLMWVDEKATSIETSDPSVAIRALYFGLAFHLNVNLILALDTDSVIHNLETCTRDLKLPLTSALHCVLGRACKLTLTLEPTNELALNVTLDLVLDLALDLVLDLALDIAFELKTALFWGRAYELAGTLDLACACARPPALQRQLQQVKDQLPAMSQEDEEPFRQWWPVHGQALIEQLRTVMRQYRNLGHDWELSEAQKEQLQQYYEATRLLADCLKSPNCSDQLRQELEATLLLPIAKCQ